MKTTKFCMLGLHLAESNASENIPQEFGAKVQDPLFVSEHYTTAIVGISWLTVTPLTTHIYVYVRTYVRTYTHAHMHVFF